MYAALGAGRMGRGIATAFAYAGHAVWLVDVKPRPAEQADGLRQAALSGHVNEITCLRAGPEGRWILSGSEDCSVILWELDKYYEIEPAGKDALIAALPAILARRLPGLPWKK